MKVFISWSGPRAKAVALALREWLPDVIQNLEPWMSEKDIPSGSRWNHEVTSELEESSFGIVVVTPENQTAPWLLFEAGAIAKRVSDSQTRVIPYLVGMGKSDLTSSPLTTFQMEVADKEGTWSLLGSVNGCMTEGGLDTERLRKAFDKYWGDLEPHIGAVLEMGCPVELQPTTGEMLQRILGRLADVAEVPDPLTAREQMLFIMGEEAVEARRFLALSTMLTHQYRAELRDLHARAVMVETLPAQPVEEGGSHAGENSIERQQASLRKIKERIAEAKVNLHGAELEMHDAQRRVHLHDDLKERVLRLHDPS